MGRVSLPNPVSSNNMQRTPHNASWHDVVTMGLDFLRLGMTSLTRPRTNNMSIPSHTHRIAITQAAHPHAIQRGRVVRRRMLATTNLGAARMTDTFGQQRNHAYSQHLVKTCVGHAIRTAWRKLCSTLRLVVVRVDCKRAGNHKSLRIALLKKRRPLRPERATRAA